MSPITLRSLRPLLLATLALVPLAGVSACGGGMSQSDIEKKIDAASVGEENVASGESASDLAQKQLDADADQQAAEEAVKRRQELQKIQEEQKAETQKVMEGDVERSAEDLAEQRFRARVAGVCDGAYARITKVSKEAEAATKAKDATQLLKVAQDYNDTLNDFMSALKAVDAPASQAALYAAWLGTIDDLNNNIRLQLVSLADAKETAKLQKKTETLTTKFLTQTAQLGVPCLSLSG